MTLPVFLCYFITLFPTSPLTSCVKGPQDHLQFIDALQGLMGLWWVKSITAKRCRENEQRAKARDVTSRENQKPVSQTPLPVELCRMHLSPPAGSCDNTGQASSTREAHYTFCAQVFPGGWSRRHSACVFRNSSAPEEVRCLAYTTLFYVRVGNCFLAKFQVSDKQKPASLAHRPRIALSGLWI